MKITNIKSVEQKANFFEAQIEDNDKGALIPDLCNELDLVPHIITYCCGIRISILKDIKTNKSCIILTSDVLRYIRGEKILLDLC